MRTGPPPPVPGGAVAVHPRRYFGGFEEPKPAEDLRVPEARMPARQSPLGSCSAGVLIGMQSKSCPIILRRLERRNPETASLRHEVSGQKAGCSNETPRARAIKNSHMPSVGDRSTADSGHTQQMPGRPSWAVSRHPSLLFPYTQDRGRLRRNIQGIENATARVHRGFGSEGHGRLRRARRQNPISLNRL
jgi:hypothetical protein